MLLRMNFVLRGLIPDSWSFLCNHKTRSVGENNALWQHQITQVQQGEPSTIKRVSWHMHVALLIAFTPDLFKNMSGLFRME